METLSPAKETLIHLRTLCCSLPLDHEIRLAVQAQGIQKPAQNKPLLLWPLEELQVVTVPPAVIKRGYAKHPNRAFLRYTRVYEGTSRHYALSAMFENDRVYHTYEDVTRAIIDHAVIVEDALRVGGQVMMREKVFTWTNTWHQACNFYMPANGTMIFHVITGIGHWLPYKRETKTLIILAGPAGEVKLRRVDYAGLRGISNADYTRLYEERKEYMR